MGSSAFDVMTAVDRHYNHDDLRASEEASMTKTVTANNNLDYYDDDITTERSALGDIGVDGLDIGMTLMVLLCVYVFGIRRQQVGASWTGEGLSSDQDVISQRILVAAALVLVVYVVFTFDSALRARTADMEIAVIAAAVLFAYVNAAGLRSVPPPALPLVEYPPIPPPA